MSDHKHSEAAPRHDRLPGIRHVVAVGSGKGGVGKSTVAVNLALALARRGARVGLLDADVLGPSTHTLLGARDETLKQVEDKVIPVEVRGIKFVSMGLIAGDDRPAILRGPMVMKYLNLFLRDVKWGELDWLVLDLPPGTGDVQLTLAQGAALDGAIVVTTPQDVAANIARRGLRMFETVKVPILGLVENMSGFVCPKCGHESHIFGHGAAVQLSKDTGAPMLGRIPLDIAVVESGDAGNPIVVDKPASAAALAYFELAESVVRKVEGSTPSVLGSFAWTWADAHGKPGWNESAVKPGGRRDVVVGIRKAAPNAIELLWEDGKRHVHDVRELRIECPCAGCMDEITGKRTLDPTKIRLDVVPRLVASVGNYALTIGWTDGHNTGIYTWESLRRLGDRSSAAYDV